MQHCGVSANVMNATAADSEDAQAPNWTLVSLSMLMGVGAAADKDLDVSEGKDADTVALQQPLLPEPAEGLPEAPLQGDGPSDSER